jgi:FMN-dependent NADH-azoreductase
VKTLLRIDSSARADGSHSRRLADEYESAWRARHTGAGASVVRRDLAAQPVPQIDEQTIRGFYTPADAMTDDARRATALSDALIAELRQADELLLSLPMYNFGIPAALKAWVDQIVRIGQTFSFDGAKFDGLLKGKSATVVVAYGAGGYQPGGPFRAGNFADPYLSFLLSFLGFSTINVIGVEQTSTNPAAQPEERAQASKRIEQILAGQPA